MMINESDRAIWSRLWIYQRERFPLAAHTPLILAFSFCAASFSARLRLQSWPEWQAVAVAFASCLIFFLQLRIADEFKDAEDDARWRPYRAVPRGLVQLKELAYLFGIGALGQLILALSWSLPLAIILLITWTYLAAMSVEFGARRWLKAHPITYLWTHMLIMPLIDLYATASDWSVGANPFPPAGLFFFLAASFFNGIVIEIGRKIRVPSQEEEGVETYSRLWGCKKAGIVWWCCLVATAICGSLAAKEAFAFQPVALVLTALALVLTVFVYIFTRQQSAKQAKMFEAAAALWTLCLYLSLGVLPGVCANV